MSENSSIEWTDHTFNPVRGCAKVSPGCKNCYAARDALRFPGIRGIWGDSGTRIVAVPDAWKAPVKWNRLAASCGTHEGATDCPICSGPLGPHRPRVFCASLADVFEDWQGDLRFPAEIAPQGWVTARWNGHELVREFDDTPMPADQRKATMDDLRTELFRLIEETPNLDWQLLTKRPENVMRMVPEHWREGFPSNVWMGTTVEDQQRADERIPVLLKIPAKVRFLSCEPLLGPVKLLYVDFPMAWKIAKSSVSHHDKCSFKVAEGAILCDCDVLNKFNPLEGIHWVICGGESGPGARPMHPEWARSLRDQCTAAKVPFFFKQWGEWGLNAPLKGEVCDFSKAMTLADDGTLYKPTDIAFPNGPRYGEAIRANHGQAHLTSVYPLGKAATGRQLDGREWNEMPSLH